MTDLMDYIKIQWADIHHTRNQEWKVLVIIVGVFYALFKISPDDMWLHVAVTILGMIACGIGLYISLMHWLIFYSKIRVIRDCEAKLGIHPNFFKPPFPVQGIIFLIYFFIGSIFSGWLTWLLLRKVWISFVTFALCLLTGFIMALIAKILIERTMDKQTPVTFDNNGEYK